MSDRIADLLVKAGAAVLALGVLATLGVMATHDVDALDRLVSAALALVPIGFCLALGGLGLLIRNRAKS